MPKKAQDDEVVMSLVDSALSKPPEERESFLQRACAGDAELYQQVANYLDWEARMQGFLLDPFFSAHTLEHPFGPGELLDQRFRIIREVAQGGMGVVYEAQDEKLNRRIALKCAKAGFGQRLPPEVRHATEISHPNVCKTFEIHTASTRLGEMDFLTMEFLAGETLSARLLREALPQDQTEKIAAQLCAGLAEAHRNHVIHGDLKSNNVILTSASDGAIRAVITDFGLANDREAATSGVNGGTPDYMAPELWHGARPSVASDIYALGVIFHELVYGRRPSAGAVSGGKAKWDRIISRCLDPDPGRRFQSADEIAEALAPRKVLRWYIAAAAALALATISGIVSYQRATAPQDSFRVAMLPFAGDDAGISKGVESALERLRGGQRARLAILSPSELEKRHVDSAASAGALVGATHVVQGTVARQGGTIVVHAFLTDTRSQANTADREFRYALSELRYAPGAIAGMVTESLRLPPLAVATEIQDKARADYQRGLIYLRKDSGVDVALGFLERAVQEDPDSPLTHAALAEAEWFKYFLSKDKSWLERSTESLRQAQIRDSDLAPVHRVAGVLLANEARYERAEGEYRRAIELEPRNGDGYRRLGQLYERTSQPDEALLQLRKALELDPGQYRTYQEIGHFYYLHDDYVEALKYVTRAVDLAPDELPVHYLLGEIFTEMGRFNDAESEFRFAIRLHTTPQTLESFGRTLMYEKNDAGAIEPLLAALKMSERHLTWMLLGDCYRRTHQTASARRAYERGLELAEQEMRLNPRDGRLRSDVAYLCARLGERRRAESEIAQALQLSANLPDTLEQAVITYEALGLRDATLGILAKASRETLFDLSRWPDLADLRQDQHFQQLLVSHQLKE